MPQLHIHIGWPKTGTTAFQHFCAENPGLLAQHGISYFATSRGHSCGTISHAIAKQENLKKHRRQFLEWAERQRDRDMLVSAEGFSGCDPDRVAEVFATDRWDRVNVIAYLRPQEELLEGWYKQMVKWGGKLSWAQYLSPRSAAWKLGDFRPGMTSWSEWCDRNRHTFIPAIFERRHMPGGNIVRDILSKLGAPDIRIEATPRNVSPSAALIDLYLRLPPIEKLQKINRLMVASDHPAATGSGDLFDTKTVALIRDRYDEANEQIRADHFPDRDRLFDLADAGHPSAPSAEGLADLLINTLAETHGQAVADRAAKALLC
ncbi:hypothetical protein [Paracoccus albus]|uniref:hypothetical protein n=1 Tax=Paracoccus albus TaxID=3017784 RepID=UPI0022F0EB9B|nr:hypothetical protein [Paracoccus albus]WBU61773.1 hypothetical protein PAF20_07730 [Paracoccus albus]